MPLGRVDDRAASTRGRAGKGDPGLLVEGLRRSDDRRSRRRMGVDGRACIPSSGTSGRCSCASLGRTQRRKALSLRSTPLAADSSRIARRLLRHAVESATEEGSARDVFSCASRRSWTMLRSAVPAERGRCRRGASGTPFLRRISAGEVPSDFPVAARASQVLDLSRV